MEMQFLFNLINMRTEAERLASYRAAFLEKVKKWKWDEPESKDSKPRGRKAKPKPQAVIDWEKPRNKFFK
jgi:hypothetical protein